MKKILITGANSYIGISVEKWLSKYPEEYSVDTVDMIDGFWRNHDFSQYDVVYHVAGIAHDTGNNKDEALYYKVNYDLAVETAEKAKASGVKQFIFMSSMLVYNGVSDRNITIATEPAVKGCYGDSKLKADLALQKMSNEGFHVAVLRPPMIFGKGCKGNFPRLIGLGDKLFFFPNIKNQRSMLYIDNLCEFIRLLINSGNGGVFFPQNPDYFCTTDIIKTAMECKGKKKMYIRLLNPAIMLAKPFVGAVNKLFGNLTYDRALSDSFNGEYQIYNNTESIKKSLEI